MSHTLWKSAVIVMVTDSVPYYCTVVVVANPVLFLLSFSKW